MLLETDQQDPKEDDQFTRESSVTSTSSTTTNRLSKFMIQIISPLLSAQRKKIINESNYQDILQKLFPHTAKFSELNMLEKIKILKRIGEAYSESTDEQFLAAKDEKTPEELVKKNQTSFVCLCIRDTNLYTNRDLIL
jgi:hypothetical protein